VHGLQHLLARTGLDMPVKPRITGLTSILDKGLGLHAVQDLVQLAGPYIDVVKLG
jgi:phosphosulfolactate synthase